VGGSWLQEEGLTGKGVHIGLIDAGFGDADKEEVLTNLFSEKRIMAYRDFEAPSHTDFFRRTSPEIDTHGSDVLTLIAGQQPGEARYGGAINATFSLARTDNALKEYRHEEDLWVAALEWMDSLGVRLINTSLGYGLGYDNPKENHKLADVNGHTSPATRAVDIATTQKGITVVVSAGNDGGNAAWGIINMPADAVGGISVGATYGDIWQKVGYSGVGPEALPYLKPDVSVFSLMGTSFSAPVVTGALACLMEKHPNRKPAEYADALRQSGHLHAAPNNYLGHGVPNLHRASLALEGKPTTLPFQQLQGKSEVVLTIDTSVYTTVVLFHKKNKTQVVSQATLKAEGGKLTITRGAEARYTTVATPKQVWEIDWKQP
jgi:subtilisin family serine protease